MEQLKRYFEENDQLCKSMGIKMVEITPGHAVARLTLAKQHHNSLGITHGGTIFTLADIAFAAASNSHGNVAVAINASINFYKGTSQGTLTATADEISLNHKLATYNINVTDDEDEIVATFQGTVYRKKQLLPINDV